MDAGQSANVNGDNNVVGIARDGGTVIIGGRRQLRLTRYEERAANLAESDAETALLSAYRQDVAPLIGREPALADLRAWLGTERKLSIRVLIGGAGRGKTRLAVELCRSLGKGWDAGFVGASDFEDFWTARRMERWRWERPTLVVLDYAAHRGAALKDWLRELTDTKLTDLPKLRLLLLERQAQRELGWLAELVGRGADESAIVGEWLDPPTPVELAPLEGLEYRRELFARLLKRAGSKREAPPIGTDAEFDRALAERKWGGDPLFLMIAGLVAAKAGVNTALSLSRADLATWIADAELNRIGKLGAARGIERDATPPGRFLRRMAALATLVQGATAKEARALVEAERAATGAAVDPGAVVRALGQALPPVEPGGAVGPILPDIVGEAALLRVFGDGGEAAEDAEIAEPRILAAARGAVKAASATLVRTAQDFAAAGRLEPIRWIEAWAEAPEADLGVLMEIAGALPEQTLALRETAASLTDKICKILAASRETSPSSDADALLAGWLNNLGNRLRDLGRREQALASAREAVELYRGLAAEQPDTFRPNLAGSLNNLGGRLSELGRREEALEAAREAVDIRRGLAAERPDAFRPDLAMALNNLGTFLSELGRREEALEAAREAADLYRGLAAERPDAFRPDLATALNNLGIRLSELGRREEALEAAREAVDIRRGLAAERPDAFRPDLAMSLNNLGAMLSALGRREEAMEAAREAVDIRRGLAAERPDAFRPNLATALNNLGIRLSELGRREEALEAAREAAELYRRLAAERPDAFRPDLAMALNNLGMFLSGLGRREEALEAAREAVELFAPLFLRRLLAHADWMTSMARNYIERCEALGQPPDDALLAPIAAALQALQDKNPEQN